MTTGRFFFIAMCISLTGVTGCGRGNPPSSLAMPTGLGGSSGPLELSAGMISSSPCSNPFPVDDDALGKSSLSVDHLDALKGVWQLVELNYGGIAQNHSSLFVASKIKNNWATQSVTCAYMPDNFPGNLMISVNTPMTLNFDSSQGRQNLKLSVNLEDQKTYTTQQDLRLDTVTGNDLTGIQADGVTVRSHTYLITDQLLEVRRELAPTDQLSIVYLDVKYVKSK
jgi:hypothetical protein